MHLVPYSLKDNNVHLTRMNNSRFYRPSFIANKNDTEKYEEPEKTFFLWLYSPTRAKASSLLRFIDHSQLHTKDDRAPLDEGLASCQGVYWTTHKTLNRHISILATRFEFTIHQGIGRSFPPQRIRLLGQAVRKDTKLIRTIFLYKLFGDHTYIFRSPSALILRAYNIKKYNKKMCVSNQSHKSRSSLPAVNLQTNTIGDFTTYKYSFLMILKWTNQEFQNFIIYFKFGS